MGLIDTIKNLMQPVPELPSMGDLAGNAVEDVEKGIEIDEKTQKMYKEWKDNAELWHKKKFYKTAKKYYDYMRSVVSKDANKAEGDKHDEYNIFCNEFWINIKTLIPNIYFQNPKAAIELEDNFIKKQVVNELSGQPEEQKVEIDPKTTELLENVVQDYYRLMNLKRHAKRCTFDGSVAGFGVLKLGWQTVIKGSESNDIELIRDDMTLCRFNPLNFLVDPECCETDLSDAKYIIFRYIKPTEEIKKTPYYKGTEGLTGSKILRFSGDEKSEQMYDENQRSTETVNVERNTLYEIWDKTNRKLIVLVDNKEMPIRYEDWPIDLDDYPCEVLSFNDDPEYFYPIADFTAYESQVLLKTKLRRKMVDLFNKLNRVFLADEDALNKDKLQQVLDAPGGGVVSFKNKQNKTRDQILFNLNDFVMNDSYLALQNICDADIEKLSGISDMARGLVTKAKRTASEIMNIQSTQNLRIEEKKDCISDFLERVTMKMILLLQANADEERVVKIQTDQGVDFRAYTKESIQGRFRVRIDVGSMVKQNPEMKAKGALDRYATLVQNPLVNQVELLKDTFKDTYQMAQGGQERLLNAIQVQIYNNPQLKVVVDALQANPQLMQGVIAAIQSQGALNAPGKPVNQPNTNNTQVNAEEARTGQITQPTPNEMMGGMV